MFWIGLIVGIGTSFIIVSILSLCFMAGECSRTEEERERG